MINVDEQMVSYTYSVAPNTRYEVDVGAEAGPPCTGQIPTRWSEIERVGCTTPPSSKCVKFCILMLDATDMLKICIRNCI